MRREFPEGPLASWPTEMAEWKVSLKKDKATELFADRDTDWADTGVGTRRYELTDEQLAELEEEEL